MPEHGMLVALLGPQRSRLGPSQEALEAVLDHRQAEALELPPQDSDPRPLTLCTRYPVPLGERRGHADEAIGGHLIEKLTFKGGESVRHALL